MGFVMTDLLEERFLKKQYEIEQQKNTANIGRLLAFLGIPIISVITIIEWVTYHNYTFVICRLLFLLPQITFLICYYTVFFKKSNYIIPLHALTISGGLLMMTALTIFKSMFPAFTAAYILSSISGGTVVMVFISFLFGAGARKYLKFMLPMTMIVQIIYALNTGWFDWKEISIFINPVITAIGVIVLAEFQHILSFNEFKQRSIVETQKKLLQHEIEGRKILQKKLFEKTIKDELTGAYNRRMLFPFLERQIGLSKLKKEKLTVCYIDLDNFKKINDLKGHLEGDLLIQRISLILKRSIRNTDIICRVGGDEFIIIFPNCDTEQAANIMERAKGEFESTPVSNETKISFSYGFAEYTMNSDMTVSDLIDEADRAMYEMKNTQNCPIDGRRAFVVE